jgi:hypothetical protein
MGASQAVSKPADSGMLLQGMCMVARHQRWWISLIVGLVVAAGCRPAVTTKDAPATAAEKTLTARDVVDHTIDAYKAALAYSDQGEVRLSYKQEGQSLADSAPLAVQYSLPNRLHVAAYQAEIACDGKHLHAIIRDESTANIDGQVVARDAPTKLTLDDLYADTVLRDTLQSGLGRHPVQLELLFGDAPLLDLVKPETPLQLLTPTDVDGHKCHGIEATLADGKYVFWIDQAAYLLRRIEYPAAALLPDLVQQKGVSDVKLVADFRQAKFEKQLADEAFAFTVPEGAKQVQYFVLPPQGLPSKLFGQKVEEFKLTAADGAAITPETVADKVTVLAWFTNDPACAWGLKQVSDAIANSPVKEKVAAYAIATEDRDVPNEQLAGALEQWQVALPLARDFETVGRDQFGVRNAPTIVILDGQGRVQIFEEGASAKLAETLPVVLERLAAGEDLAAEIVGDANKAQSQYAQNLAAASGSGARTALVELAVAEPAKPRDPEHFKRTKLWSTADKSIAEPGNFLVVTDKDHPRIYVIDGARTVVELSPGGEALHVHKLDLPEDSGISYLRSAVDKEGKRWIVGSALLGQRLYVFDENWKTTLRYPPEDQPHEGLHAVEIADLEDDGTPELYVGYWSLNGVQEVTLEGKRVYSNRVVPTVLSIVATPKNEVGWRKIIVSGDRGYLYRMNQYLHHDPKLDVPGRQIHRLAAAEWESPLATTYCGISHQTNQPMLAIGLNADLQEVWNYKLPAGEMNNPIEYFTSARLRSDEQGEWLLAGPDGSVHIVSDNGEFSDSFALGELLTGISSAKLGDARVVLTATKSGVTAWKLERK